MRLVLFFLFYLALFPENIKAQSTPVEDCFTFTYKFKIGTAASSITDGRSFIDKLGSSYFTGSDKTNPGLSVGIIHKNDYNQSPSWTYALSVDGKSLAIESMDELPDGDLVIVGSASNPDGTNAQLYIARLVNNGAIVWSRLLPELGFQGKTIAVSRTGEILYTGQSADGLLFGCMLPDGSLKWLKKSAGHNNPRIAGLIAKSDHTFTLAFTETSFDRQVGKLFQLNPFSGNLNAVRELGGNLQQVDYILHDIEEGNNRTHLSGIYRSGNDPYQFFDMRLSPGEIEEFKLYSLPGRTVTADAKSDITYSGSILSFIPTGNSTEVLILRTAVNTSQPQNIRWAKQWILPQPASRISTNFAYDGGFLITTGQTNTNPGAGIYAIKTDSSGFVKNCEGLNFEVSATARYQINLPAENQSIEDLNPSAVLANSISSPYSIFSQFECKNMACAVRPPEPTCIKTFARNYRSPVFMDMAKSLVLDGSSDFLVFGNTFKYQSISIVDFMASFNASGKLKERRQLQVGNLSHLSKVIRAKNGDLVLAGFVNEGTDRFLSITRLAADYSVVGNHAYPIDNLQTLFIADLVEDDVGNFYLAYSNPTSLCSEQRIVKLNPDGSINWLRVYSNSNSCLTSGQSSMTQDVDYLYLASEAAMGAVIVKIRKTTGDLIWSKEVNGPNSTYWAIANNISILDDNLILHGDAHENGTTGMVILQLNKEGSLIRALQIPIASGAMVVTYNSDIVLVGNGMNGSGYFVRMDNAFNLINSKLTLANAWSFGSKIIEAPDGGIIGIGNNSYETSHSNDFTVFKYNPDGSSVNCATDTLLLPVKDIPINLRNVDGNHSESSFSSIAFPVSFFPYALQENKNFCISESTCLDFEFIGPSNVCDDQPFKITARRNANCKSLVYFSLDDNSTAEIQEFTDTTVLLWFRQSGSVTLTGRMFNGCEWIEHVMELNASFSNQQLDLGTDTSICEGTLLEISAGSDFASYRWNSGNEEPAITVSGAGKYYVDVVDGCGIAKSDTIIVSEQLPFPLSLGNNRMICKGDTVFFRTATDFKDHIWSWQNSVLPVVGNVFEGKPESSGVFTLEAVDPNGCNVAGSVEVIVREKTALELSAVLPFCEGDSVLISAPGGFELYEWSTGAATQSIYVKSAGIYSLYAVSSNSCSSTDSLEIERLYPLPLLEFPDYNGICVDQVILLDGGAQAGLVWQDGSTDRYYSVFAPGVYYATAVNDWGCSSSDTVVISRHLEKPAQFLPIDTAVCRYGSIIISAESDFSMYRWSTGATGQQINLKKAGLYWLDVTDQNGCTGRDSIVVTEIQCQQEGIYFPNVFTPNGDGKNDRFKPIAVGNFLQYNLSIYNRFGQLIFSTSSILDGWDGLVRGYPQNSGNFVWTCIFQLDGLPMEKVKGNVVLIR